MRRLILIVFTVFSWVSYGQNFEVDSFFATKNEKGNIEGTVYDKGNQDESFQFVTVTIMNTAIKTTTDEKGAFQFSLNPGIYTLVYDFIGYEKEVVTAIEVRTGETTTLKQGLNTMKIPLNLITVTTN